MGVVNTDLNPLIVDIFEDAIDSKVSSNRSLQANYKAEVLDVDEEGVVWVHIFGGSEMTPVSSSIASVESGDVVEVRIENGRATLLGNMTSPSAGVVAVDRVEEKADVAQETAERSMDYAVQASESAMIASVAASAAQSSADDAASAASEAQASADDAAAAAASAQTTADSAAAAAASAQADATAAQTSASSAAAAASIADSKADAATLAAAQAQADATMANTYSNAALDQLSVVQDVIGVLDYATKNGTFALTQDTEVRSGKVYFTYDSQTGDYSPVIDPQNSSLSDYYELTYNAASMGDFMMSHLTVTSRGLWVLPNGIGSATTPDSGESQTDSDARQGDGYKMLLASGGMYIYDSNGVLVRSDTASGTDFSVSRQWHMGSNDAYILYTPASGQTPAKIVIGGSNIQLGSSKTLSQWEEELSAARDACVLSITSTNGNVFKQNTGVSTTFNVRIFVNDGSIIESKQALTARYGAGAYLQWKWKDSGAVDFTTLLSTDSRITRDGFSLTVEPEDISTQAVINCELVY